MKGDFIMTEPVRGTTQTQNAQNAQQPKPVQQEKSAPDSQNIGKLLTNRAGAVVMAGPTVVAGALTVVGSFLNGVLNPNTTVDKSVTKGIEIAGQGAEMLDKMWQGKYF